MKPTNSPLTVKVTRGQLVIRIGVNTLAWAADAENGGPLSDKYRVGSSPKDELIFAKDVARALMAESEDGSHLLSAVLDQAITEAFYQGSGAVIKK